MSRKRDDLVKVGLIGETISGPIQPSNIFQQEVLRKFLSVYIEDTEQKLRVRIHNQNMTTAAKAHADRKTFGHLS